jgi:hypothetical protein
MSENSVWEFTNQKKLSKSEFIDYFERKVFRTIRKYDMLPKDRVIKLTKSDDLNTKVLQHILKTKFKVELSTTPNISSLNLSQAAEDTFQNVLQGKFTGPKPDKCPLYNLSDKEVELYAKLTNISGKNRKVDKKIQPLFSKFLKKNQDLEVNIVNALNQING